MSNVQFDYLSEEVFKLKGAVEMIMKVIEHNDARLWEAVTLQKDLNSLITIQINDLHDAFKGHKCKGGH